MEKSTNTLIKEWQEALQIEIHHLKKYGSSKYLLLNGRLLSKGDTYTYFFDTSSSIKIPINSQIHIEWGKLKQSGRMLSSEGKSVIIELDKYIGDLIQEAFLFHDPWELLEQLISRFDEVKKSKRKRLRIKRLMTPTMMVKHPSIAFKSGVQELFLRSKYNSVTFVWGPPGTGKTYTLARVAANHYFKGKKVLILSHSNQAVDVLLSEVSFFVKKKDRFQLGDIIRYGSHVGERMMVHEGITTSQLLKNREPSLFDNKEELTEEKRLLKQDLAQSFSKRDSDQLLQLEKKIARVLEKIRQKEIQFVKEAQVIGTTLAKAASDPTIYEKNYDFVIVDEASMAYVPQAAFAASLGKHVIISGDFKQLPPIASARHPLVNHWLKEDIFHRANVVDSLQEGMLHPQLFLLKEQRRMHPDISAFTNRVIYKSLVGDHKSVRTNRNDIVAKVPFPNRASIMIDTSFTGQHAINERTSNSRMNLMNLLLSFQLLHESYLAGARSIGYVSPYRAQANLMETLLSDLYKQERLTADIISATVHRFQGSERDVMIFDTVDSYPQERAGMLLTGKESERLLNVAITRTKGKFIHVCDTSFIRHHVYQSKTLRQLVEHQKNCNQNVEMKEVGSWIKNQHPKLQWMHARKLERVFQDIQSSKRSIIISLPDQASLSDEWRAQLDRRNKNVKLTMISSKKIEIVGYQDWLTTLLPFPFVIIDQRYLWLGLPLEGAKRVQPPHLAIRLDSLAFTEQLLSQLPIK